MSAEDRQKSNVSRPTDPPLRANPLARWGLAISLSVAAVVLALFIVLVFVFLRMNDIRRGMMKSQTLELLNASSLPAGERELALNTILAYFDAAHEGAVEEEAARDYFAQLTDWFCILRAADALADSRLPSDRLRSAREKIERIYGLISRNALSEDDLATLPALLPNRRGVMKPPPWSEAEVAQMEEGLTKMMADKPDAPGTARPDFSAAIRMLAANLAGDMRPASAPR